MLRHEAFLDATNIESVSGLTYGVNRPTKHASNPVWTTDAAEQGYDFHLAYLTALQDGATTKLWYNCGDREFDYLFMGYATSTDGLTFTRASNLGLVSFGGNTNNNLITSAQFNHVMYEPTLTATPYVMVSTQRTGAQCKVWTSADGIHFSLACNLPSTVWEAHSIVRRPDGRWIVYSQENGELPSGHRSVGASLSVSTDLADGFTDQGVILASTSHDREYYACGAFVHEELIYAPVMIYDTGPDPHYTYSTGTDDQIFKIALYVSRATDGLTFTLKDDDWLPAGTYVSPRGGAFDGGNIVIGGRLNRSGDDWRYYYHGTYERHHEPTGFLYQRKLGLASVGFERVGKLTGTGTVILDAISGASAITINSVGTVEAELLDASTGAVLTGYARADCDAIPADTYGTVVSWNGLTVTPDSYKVKLYLTSATVHSVSVEEADPLTLYTDDHWTQDGTTLTVVAPRDVLTTCTASVVSTLGGTLRFTGTHADRFTASLDGVTYAATVEVPAGTTAVWLGVTPEATDGGLTVQVGVWA